MRFTSEPGFDPSSSEPHSLPRQLFCLAEQEPCAKHEAISQTESICRVSQRTPFYQINLTHISTHTEQTVLQTAAKRGEETLAGRSKELRAPRALLV